MVSAFSPEKAYPERSRRCESYVGWASAHAVFAISLLSLLPFIGLSRFLHKTKIFLV